MIQIVLDDEKYIKKIKDFLEPIGYLIEQNLNPEQMIDSLREKKPDLLLVGMFLKNTTGILLLNEIRREQEFEDLPIIIISEDVSDEAVVVSLSSGANDILHKSTSLMQLSIRIQNALDLLRYKQESKKLTKKLEKEKNLLFKYFSQDIVENILNEEISEQLGGVHTNASILFLDIRDSTGLAEHMEPRDFADFISFVFTDIMDLIIANKGSINKLLGDGILATFGCPVSSENDALNCVNCSIGIKKYIRELNEIKPTFLKRPIKVGMGIATGNVFAGNIGSSRRMEYTVLGDPVNVANRLQNMTKEFDAEILIDDETYQLVKNQIITEKEIEIKIRGKSNISKIWLLDDVKDISVKENIDIFLESINYKLDLQGKL